MNRNRELNQKTVRVAVGGVCCALTVVLLMLNNLLPSATVALTACAAVVVFFISVEYGITLAAAVYVASSIICVFAVASNPNVFWLYTAVFGLYSVLKKAMDNIKKRVITVVLKTLYAVASASVYIGALLFIIGVEQPLEFARDNIWVVPLCTVAYLALFFIYDSCLSRLAGLYFSSLRNRIFRGH